MDPEKIKVGVTETGQTLDVVVYSKRADRIEIVLGEGRSARFKGRGQASEGPLAAVPLQANVRPEFHELTDRGGETIVS